MERCQLVLSAEDTGSGKDRDAARWWSACMARWKPWDFHLWHCDLGVVDKCHGGRGLDAIQCSLPMEDRRVALRELSEASFSECKFSLSLTDLFIIIFSGVAVSIAAIISSFFLATVVQCFQRCTPNKDTDDEDDDEDD